MIGFKKFGRRKIVIMVTVFICVIAISIVLFLLIPSAKVSYDVPQPAAVAVASSTADASSTAPVLPPPFVVTHVATPIQVKAVYFTSWAAGNANFRKEMLSILDSTEINAVVIDVKDYTGRISFPVDDPMLKATGASQDRIPDIKEFIGELHKRGVYVIGRISAFQDSFMINIHPDWAVKTEAGAVWQDYKGVKWLDPGAKPVWDYLTAIGDEAYADGFDELNFDYMRFPSDGNLRDIAYSWDNGETREEVMKKFYTYLGDHFASTSVPISIDLFGLTTSAEDDLGIGQMMTDALPHFDFIDPMVYPSHFGTGFIGYAHPAQHPYDVVKYAMEHGVQKADAASTSPMKLRPWLQAFDLGAVYTPAMIRAQINATYDTGLNSWLLWDAGSVYDKTALVPGKDDSSATDKSNIVGSY